MPAVLTSAPTQPAPVSPANRSLAVTAAGVFLWYLLTYVLLPVPAIREGLDESWRAFLTWAFLHSKQFGRDVIFTYGPWGFLLEPRGGADAYRWQIFGRLAIAAAIAPGLAAVGACWLRSAPVRLLWTAVMVLLAEPALLVPFLLFFLSLRAVPDFPRKQLVLGLLAVAAGLVVCTKFTGLLIVAALLPGVIWRRRTRWIAVAVPASAFAFWALAGQQPGNVLAFVRHSLEISTGYAKSMAMGRPVVELLLCVLLCGLPLLYFASRRRVREWETAVRLLGLVFCEFLFFRHALIRSDAEHVYAALVMSATPLGLLAAIMPAEEGRPRWPRWSLAFQTAFAVGVLATLLIANAQIRLKAGVIRDSLRLYPSQWRGLLERPRPLPSSTVDVFPSELAYALQRNLAVANRPVIQSYSAYTAKLSALNAAFLESSQAPGSIYLHSLAIDDRYPTMEDSLAWRSLITHYIPKSVSERYIVLSRRTVPAPFQPRLILERTAALGQSIEIPSSPGDLIWAEIAVSRSLAGRLLDAVYRRDPLELQVETTRRKQQFKLMDENTPAGFLLSPYAETAAAMLDFWQPTTAPLASERVLRIEAVAPKLVAIGFQREVRVRLYSWALPDAPSEFPWMATRGLARTLRTTGSLASSSKPPSLEAKANELRLRVGSESSGWINAGSGKSLTFRYGMDAGESLCNGPIHFRIRGGGEQGGSSVLWEDTRSSGGDWAASANVYVPAGASRLYFETSAPEGCNADGAYWSSLEWVN